MTDTHLFDYRVVVSDPAKNVVDPDQQLEIRSVALSQNEGVEIQK